MQENIDDLIGNRRPNPFESVSIFSKLSYSWLHDLLKLGLKRPIESGDVYQTLKSHRSKTLTETFDARWNDDCMEIKKPKLTRILQHIYAKRVIGVSILYTILNTSIRSVQPQFIGNFVYHLSANRLSDDDDDSQGMRAAYINGASIIICSVLLILINQPFNFYMVKWGMEIRLVCCSMIYRKILRMSKANVFDGFNGKVLNLMSTDVTVLDQSLQFTNAIWKGPLEMIVFGYMIYREIGVCGWFGIGFIAAFIPLQVWIGKMAAKYRLQTTRCSDKRVKVMKEILHGIQLIKMYTWEPAYCHVIDKIRNAELLGVRGVLLVKGLLMSLNIVPRMAIFLSLVSFVLFGNVFNARQVFIVTTYFNFLYDSMVFYWPLGITSWAESYVGLRRIEDFLLLPEKRENKSKPMLNNEYINYGLISDEKDDSFNTSLNRSFSYRNTCNDTYIIFDNCSVALIGEKITRGIENIELKLNTSCAILGDVGSGKSILLKTILGDLPLMCGHLTVSGSLSYAAQEPWLFQATVRQNIIFTEPFDAKRYAEVIRACALESDLQQWPSGDRTNVGERGVCLSGGQRARINLARAVYRRADIYLLDDPLAAVDAQVGKYIAEKCITKFLRGKMVVFVTHQLQYIKQFSKIIVMNEGKIAAYGNIKPVNAGRIDMAQTNDEHNDSHENDKIDDCQTTSETVHRESESTGAVKMSVYVGYFKSMGNISIVIAAICMLSVEQCAVGVLDYYVAHWVNWENDLKKAEFAHSHLSFSANASIAVAADAVTKDDAIRSNISSGDDAIDQERAKNIYMYCGIVALVLYLVVQRLFGFVYLCSQASNRLHSRLMRAIMRTTMRFFCVNNSGRILNRFSKDISIIDTSVPTAIYYTIYFLLQSISTLVLISFGNAWLIILVFVLTGIFFGLRYIYVSTARCMKRIEATARSPMFSHVNATIDGLSTIQVHHDSLQSLCNEFDALQDDNISAGFIFYALSRALSLWIEVVSLLYMAIVIAAFLWLENHSSGGRVGLAITQILFLGTLSQWGIKQTADLENHMTSVERVLEYTNLPSEDADAKLTTTVWPANGAITFKSVSLRYSCDAEPTLRDLNIHIPAGAKVAIVGRTGAGKSSIVQALFRFAHIDGYIDIDGVDIMSVDLTQLRRSITIIAQESILFSGTVRDNMDPLREYSDADVWNALEEVELKHLISRNKDGLAAIVTNGGANFSLGQRQLFCLARAVLRPNKIVILDEATANIDDQTDKIVQRMISEKFANSTVLAITHRIHSVMNYDKILVMDAGRAVEYDSPNNLVHKNDGFFNSLFRNNNNSFGQVQ